MKATAEDLEGIIAEQLVHLKRASSQGPLVDEDWEALAHIARIVRTLAVHDVKAELERAPELSTADIARALRELADGKL